MKKLLVLALAFTAVFTACNDREETPTLTGIGKIPTLDTLDVRDMASGEFFQVIQLRGGVTDTVYIEISRHPDDFIIDQLMVEGSEIGKGYGYLTNMDGQDFGFVFGFENFMEDYEVGFYEIEEDRYTFIQLDGDRIYYNRSETK